MRLKLRQPAAKTPCKCGSRGGIYTEPVCDAVVPELMRGNCIYLSAFIPDVKLPAYFLKAVSYLYISERPIYVLIAYLPISIPHTLTAGE